MILSTLNSSNIVNQTLLTDIKQSQEIRRQNEQLKKDVELLKYDKSKKFSLSPTDDFRLKCNERALHEEEVRILRQQVRQGDDYRAIIAKKDAQFHVRDHLLAYRKSKH